MLSRESEGLVSPMNNFYECFEQSVKKHPARIAIQIQRSEGVDTLTYAELFPQVESAARWLAGLGLKAGDRCAILANNDPNWCIAYLGVLRLGAVAVPLDTGYSASQIATVIEDSGAKFLFTSERYREPSQEAAGKCREPLRLLLLHDSADGLTGLNEVVKRADTSALAPCPATLVDPAVMLYTSGTTSDPKGVVLTHKNITVEVDIASKAIQLDYHDRILGVLPLFHSLAQVANLLLPLGIGACVVFLETLNTTELLRALAEREITAFCCVPQFFYLIHQKIQKQLSEAGWLARTAFRGMLRINGFLRDTFRLNLGRLMFAKVHKIIGLRMRYLITGGSRFESAIGRDFFCMGFDILQAYGLTECTGGATLIRREHGWTASVGTPLDGVEVKIAPSDKTEGQDGEVLLRGPNIMQGYYNRPDANAEVFQDGWFCTGDLGYLDEKNYLHITGRKKEMIALSSGKNIYPEDVESHYLQTPYIKELCVLGVARPGEPAADRLHAVIVPDFDFLRERKIVNTREILRFEIENLSVQAPANKRILSYDIWTEELPRTTTRKLKRFAIEKLLQERRTTTAGESGEPERELSPEDEVWAAQPDVQRALTAIRDATHYEGALLPDANIELALGLDSLERVELLSQMENVFSSSVPDDLASGIYTVRELVEAVLASRGEGESGQQAGDTWGAMLQGTPQEDPELQALLKPKRLVAPGLFALLKIIHVASRVLFRFQVRGKNNFPSEGPFILSPNHQSYLDAFLLVSVLPYSTFRRTFFVGASEYFETPLMKRLARMANIIPVDPDANLLRAMQAGAFGLRNGKVLILFPEGERTIDGKVKKFKKGAPILSLNLGVPIVPVALQGLFEVWPRGRAFQGFSPVRMEFGQPLLAGADLSQGITQAEAETLYARKTSELREAVEELWLALVRQAS